jgi:hypothetical protein
MSALPIRAPAAAIALLWLALPLAGAQSAPQLLASTEVVSVQSVRMIPAWDGPALEILASRPLIPSISKLENPSRLVIDLPGAALSGSRPRIDFHNEQVKGVRVSQYRTTPSPVTRIVVDLAAPVDSSWDAAGNRLMVRMRTPPQTAAKPPSVPAFTQGVQPVAVPLNPGSGGGVAVAGSKIPPGSAVTAGSDTAILRLGRGGEVRVCPGTTVSVTASQNGRALMLGMSTGALEAHYYLDASADSILTPDFRIQLPGPGQFHYAVSADSRGNTCVRALPGNTASVIVSELLGDGTYQVKPTEQVVFHSGSLTRVDAVMPTGCGCPPPAIPVMRASTAPPSISESKMPSPVSLAAERQPLGTAPAAPATASPPVATAPETVPLPPSKPNEVHVQVEAPFVFRASDPPPPEPAPIQEVELLPLHVPRPAFLQSATLPPVQMQPKPASHGIMGKIKSFFAALFR